jgi:hypothetical protein
VPGFQLSPGVVVDPERREAYVMSPDGGIVAVDLGEGAPVWRTTSADKPLNLSGELLIGQAEAPGPGNALRIVTLDTSRRGEQVTEALVELPPGVQPMIAPSLNRSFTVEARPEPGEAAVSWEFVEQPLRGIAPGPMEVLPGEAPPAASAAAPPAAGPGAIAATPMGAPEPGGEATILRGAARVDLSSGTITATEAPPTPAAPGPPTVSAGDSAPASDLAPDATLPGVPQPQFLSADRRHVLSSQRVAEDPEWDKYQWTIFERESGRRVGEIRTHLRYAPFFVDDTRIIYQTPPFARRQGRRMVQEPLQIRAADLSTGASVWSQPVRDTVDREPPPP